MENETSKYWYCNFTRSKSGIKNISIDTIKKELYVISNKCYICNKEFELKKMELEHLYPIRLGGETWDKNNISLVCKKCHMKKTLIDKKIINYFKNLDIIYNQVFCLSPKKIKEIYNFLFPLCEEAKFNKDNFWESKGVFFSPNKEEDNGTTN